MVRTKPSEGEKRKPRGRPFPKGHSGFTKGTRRRESEDEVLDASGHESGDVGAVIVPESKESIVGHLNKELEPMKNKITSLEQNEPIEEQPITQLTSHGSGGEYAEPIKEEAKVATKIEDTILEEITFMDGDNKLSIVLKKKHNRMYRIQMFINDKTEIRPSTYAGAAPAQTVWQLLKGALNK